MSRGSQALALDSLAASAEEVESTRKTQAFIDAVSHPKIEEEKEEVSDVHHPFYSFNLTMEEEHKKIRNNTLHIKKAAPDN